MQPRAFQKKLDAYLFDNAIFVPGLQPHCSLVMCFPFQVFFRKFLENEIAAWATKQIDLFLCTCDININEKRGFFFFQNTLYLYLKKSCVIFSFTSLVGRGILNV